VSDPSAKGAAPPSVPSTETAAMPGVARALARLQGAVSPQVLFERATQALCEEMGFERAAVFGLRGRTLVAQSVHSRGTCGPGESAPARRCSEPFQLGPWLREADVVRRRRALLVDDAPGDPRALALLPGARSYVAAPVVCRDNAVALVHADCGPGGAPATELERDALSAFAGGLGYALERAVLAERLRAQSERVLGLARATAASVTEPGVPATENFADAAASAREVAPDPELKKTLTRRELEVLAMLADGDTNAAIAGRLVVSEDTVKTHVKNILRKLGVHNRSQAVSRYFRAPNGLAHGPSGTRATANGSG
jgi:LuxR family transcriptional regulator, regulator of acetate metabolism